MTEPYQRRLAIASAMLLSVPGVLLALAAAGYIMLAIATEPGYRNGFLGYGIQRSVMDVAFVCAVAAAAAIATGRVTGQPLPLRVLAWCLVIAGAIAAVLMEIEFWSEAEWIWPRGFFAVPLLAWAGVGIWLRHPSRSATGRGTTGNA